MTFVRPGDTLVVVKFDRLGRSTRDVLNLVPELEQRGAALASRASYRHWETDGQGASRASRHLTVTLM